MQVTPRPTAVVLTLLTRKFKLLMSQCISPLLCKNATPLAQSLFIRSRTRNGTFGTSVPRVVMANVFRSSDSMANAENSIEEMVREPSWPRPRPSSGSFSGLLASKDAIPFLGDALRLASQDFLPTGTFGSLCRSSAVDGVARLSVLGPWPTL